MRGPAPTETTGWSSSGYTPGVSFEHEIDLVRQAVETRRSTTRSWSATTTSVERLRQPLLAGALLRRRERRHPRPALRRGTLRAVRAHHPGTARRRPRAAARWRAPAWRRRPTGTSWAPRPISAAGAADRLIRTGPPPLNHWALAGAWTIGGENVVLDEAGGSIAFRFHARDAHLVMSSGERGRFPSA